MKKYFPAYALMFIAILSLPIYSKDIATELPSNKTNIRTIEWTDLMPDEDLELLESMQPVDHDVLSEEELAKDNIDTKKTLKPSNSNSLSKFEDPIAKPIQQAGSSAKKRTWKDALVSTAVRPEFNNVRVKLGGYIVPLDYEKNLIKTFFFVPYYGACIHVPPPPPNQIIYVRTTKGLNIQDIYRPYSATGTLRIEKTEKDIGVSSYSLDAESVRIYRQE